MRTIILLVIAVGIITFPGVGWTAEKRLVIGVIPEMNLLKQMNRYEAICRYLEKKTGFEIVLQPVGSYGRIYEKMRDGELDGGFFGSLVYAITRKKLGILPLARPQSVDGTSTYAGVTFVRKESGIRKVEQLKGKTIALVDPATTGGYLAQKYCLKRHGIDLEKDLKILWKGSHDEVVTAVMLKEADAGGAKDSAIRHYTENRTFARQLRILDKSPSPPVPENALAVRKDLDPVITEKIKNTLLQMDSDPAGRKALARFGAARFVETRDGDYLPLYKMINRLKIDLTSYPYQIP